MLRMLFESDNSDLSDDSDILDKLDIPDNTDWSDKAEFIERMYPFTPPSRLTIMPFMENAYAALSWV